MYHVYYCPSRPFVPRDTRTEVGCTIVYHRYCCVLLSVLFTCFTGHKDKSGMYSCTTDTVVYSCPSRPFVPWDTRTEVGCTSAPQILLCTTVRPIHLYHGTQGQKWDVLVYHRYCCVLLSTLHPVHLYHGTQGQKWNVLVYHRYCCVLLSIPSICTTGYKDRSGMYYSVPQILLCTTVRPVHLYHGTQGQKCDVLVYHRYCCVLLSIPSICTTGHKDRSGCTTDTVVYYCLSCPFVPRDTRTEVGCTSVPQILLCTTVRPVHLYHGTQGQKFFLNSKHYRIKGVTCTVLVWESNCQSQKNNKIIKYVVQSWVEMWPSEHATSIVSPEMVGW